MCYSFKKLVLIELYLSLSLIVGTSLQWEKSAEREQCRRVFCSQCGTKKTSYSIQNVTRIDAAFSLLHSHQNDSHLYLLFAHFYSPICNKLKKEKCSVVSFINYKSFKRTTEINTMFVLPLAIINVGFVLSVETQITPLLWLP